MIDENPIKLSGYDQKAFLQIRLHNKLVRIDRLSANLLDFNSQYNAYNYKIVFADLCSIMHDISAKLSKTDKDKIKLIKKKINIQIKKPIMKKGFQSRYANREKSVFQHGLWNIIEDDLSEFRMQIEILMERHGFQPSKDDESQAVIKM